jgi:hypothetical protein
MHGNMNIKLTTHPLCQVTENQVLGERHRNFTQPNLYALQNSEAMTDFTGF